MTKWDRQLIAESIQYYRMHLLEHPYGKQGQIARLQELYAVFSAPERPDPLGEALNSGDGTYKP